MDLFTIGALGGVGLTVALFMANEAFIDPGLQGQAKLGAVSYLRTTAIDNSAKHTNNQKTNGTNVLQPPRINKPFFYILHGRTTTTDDDGRR